MHMINIYTHFFNQRPGSIASFINHVQIRRVILYIGLMIVFSYSSHTNNLFAKDTKLNLHYSVDPVTRLVHVSYQIPKSAPDSITIDVKATEYGKNHWKPAHVQKLRSETAIGLCPGKDWDQELLQGKITERNAAGLQRTFIWSPYPEFEKDGHVNAILRVTLSYNKIKITEKITVITDNSDVVYIENWDNVLQKKFCYTCS